MTKPLTTIAALALWATLTAADDNAAKADREKLQGAWVAIAYEAQNQKLPAEDLKKVLVDLSGNRWTLRLGTQVVKGNHQLDAAMTPKKFDGAITDGPGEGDALLGIYKIDGDIWTQCWADPGKERPTEFKADAEKGHNLIVWKRKPK